MTWLGARDPSEPGRGPEAAWVQLAVDEPSPLSAWQRWQEWQGSNLQPPVLEFASGRNGVYRSISLSASQSAIFLNFRGGLMQTTQKSPGN
jgi:hypothetical protein